MINGENGLKAQIKTIEENAEKQIAAINSIMDLYADVVETESVYLGGVDKMNEIWATYVEDAKVAFDKKLVLDAAEEKVDALYIALDNAEAIEAAIAAAEEEIQALKDEITELETTIKTAEDAVAMVLEPEIALIEEQIAVQEAIVASLKAELEGLLAQLGGGATEEVPAE